MSKHELVKLCDTVRQRVERTIERFKAADLLPRFQDGTPCNRDGKNDLLAFASVIEICKADNLEAAVALVDGAAAGQFCRNPDDERERALAHMAELKPETHLEAMLISQMVAVNAAITRTLHSALMPNQTSSGIETNMVYSTKLQRTFLAQIDALQKLRGKGQRGMRIDHVTVNSGGQAVVGHIEHSSGSGSDEQGSLPFARGEKQDWERPRTTHLKPQEVRPASGSITQVNIDEARCDLAPSLAIPDVEIESDDEP